jgi:hypothetical protein
MSDHRTRHSHASHSYWAPRAMHHGNIQTLLQVVLVSLSLYLGL